MRRHLTLFLMLLLGVLAAASAQAGQITSSEPGGKPIALQHTVSGKYEPISLELSPGPYPRQTFLDLNPATDSCDINTSTLGVPGGGTTTTNDMTEEASDPALACMWGIPLRIQGWRTVWYQFTATETTNVTISTLESNYDTVLAVYSSPTVNGCSTLTQIACNDDYHFFESQVTFPVREGETYYVEVADWKGPANGTLTLALSAWPSPFQSAWQIVDQEKHISRHVAVVDGNKLYVIGGQTVVSGNPERTGRTSVFNTVTQRWTDLANMPSSYDAFGYSNTTAAVIDHKIYIPSGYVGFDDVYDGSHRVFDISTGKWGTAAANTWAGGIPAIYSAAVTGPLPPFTKGYYLTGGLTGPLPGPEDTNWGARDELYYYPKDAATWTTALPAMATGRFGHVAARQPLGIRDSICVAGGIGKDADDLPITLGSAECFDIDGGSWSNIAPLNHPRYFAGSAVENETWYVFGGIDVDGESIGTIERYDPANDKWDVLDVRFDLANPARSWPRGGFVGDNLYVAGGEANGFQVVSLLEKADMPLPPLAVPVDPVAYLPIVFNQFNFSAPGQNFASARPIGIGETQRHRFEDVYDDVHVFTFLLGSSKSIRVELTQIPEGSDYNLYVYSENKFYHSVDKGMNPGNQPEIVPLTLSSGRYYIVVERVFPLGGTQPSDSKYRIKVEG